jgi:uncharacterized alpha-E superfamily protein
MILIEKPVMLSRVAHSLYWMSRYIERAENFARMLDVNLQLMLDCTDMEPDQISQQWMPLLVSSGMAEDFEKMGLKPNSYEVTEYMTFLQTNPSSVISCLMAARENARQVRDQISIEMFECINESYLFLQSTNAREIWQTGAHHFYDKIKKYSHEFHGLVDATFSQQEGYEFIQLGKYIERADKTTRILDLKYHILLPEVTDVGGAIDIAQWQALLRSASALEAYRRIYLNDLAPWKIAEFLIYSPYFPRSLSFCIANVIQCLEVLQEEKNPQDPVFRKLYRLHADFKHSTLEEITKSGLHEFLDDIQDLMIQLDQSIYQKYMYHPQSELEVKVHMHQQEMQQQQFKGE